MCTGAIKFAHKMQTSDPWQCVQVRFELRMKCKHDFCTVLRPSGNGGKKLDQEYCAIQVAAADLLKAVTERSKEKVKFTMDALAAEARRIEKEIEEFSSRTAKDVARLVTVMSDIEDDSGNITKKIESIDEEIFSLAREKKAFRELLTENKGKLEKLQTKKDEMDQMIDREMKRFNFLKY